MNVNFEYSKTLAIEGSILLLLSLIPTVGWILGIVGVVLLLRSMKEFSNYYEDEKIYQDTLTGVKFYIIAISSGCSSYCSVHSWHLVSNRLYLSVCAHARLRSWLSSFRSRAWSSHLSSTYLHQHI